jgi:methyltransferase (TIGR00027 family)
MQANLASATARVIALATVLQSFQRPETESEVIPKRAVTLCQRMLQSSWIDRWLCASMDYSGARLLWKCLERLTLPGICQHYARRKYVIEQTTRQAIANETKRVVVLGAGFDTLCLRLAAEFPRIQFIEVDHPATQSAKRAGISAEDAGMINNNLILLPADLSSEQSSHWLDALQTDTAKTLFIAEGLLMYFSSKRVEYLLGTELSRFPNAQILMSYMMRWPDGRSGFRPDSFLIRRWLRWVREPFLSAFAADQIPALLSDLGLTMELHTCAPFSAASCGALRGENIVLASYTGAANKLACLPIEGFNLGKI